MNTDPPTNSAQTSPDAAPELRTRVYRQKIGLVRQAAVVTAFEQTTWLRGWRVVPSEDDTIRVEVPVLVFTDDLTITVDQNDGQTRVNVSSKSRVGKGDFGENRRHVAQFLRALDEAIGDSET